VFRERLDPGRHRGREPVHRGRAGHHLHETVGVVTGHRGRIERAVHSLRDRNRTGERALHRDLLVEQHADQ